MTRIEEVDDVENEKSGEQRKQEGWEEFVRQPSVKEIIEHGLTLLPLRSWCRHCMKVRSERRTVEQQLKQRDKTQKSIWTDIFVGNEKEG